MTELPPIVVGEPGEPGKPGEPSGHGGKGGKGGKGGIGLTGPEGQPAGWSDKAMAFLLAVLTAVFGFMFARVAINQNAIQRANYDSCLGGAQIVVQFNALLNDLIWIERSNPNQDLADRRVAAYTAGMIPAPDCGPNPSE